jgi:S-formylglutathione hydrolase FrmB
MAFLDCSFHSETLGMACSMYVILPQPPLSQAGRRPRRGWPTLWLLHGLSDDHTIWMRRTSIERYVTPLQLAVVMPNIHRSFYTDMAEGGRYWSFLTEELPGAARALFPLSPDRRDNFVAGLSMGGYGAFKWALRRPECFAAAASLSGALDVASFSKKTATRSPAFFAEMRRIFGPLDRIAGSENDLLALARRAARRKTALPALYQWCGTEDYLLDANRRFLALARRCRLPLTSEEGPGAHEWKCWDRQIQRVLEWLPLRNRR